MRPQRVVAGNWKMHKTRPEAASLIDELLAEVDRVPSESELIVFPPFTAIAEVAARCAGSRIAVGGQNLHSKREGAFTGEISARMLLEAGATYVLVGHSERRHLFSESDDQVAEKLEAALSAGLSSMLCLGETLEERETGRTIAVLRRQLEGGCRRLQPTQLPGLLLAYEPVWAIGTGRTATPELAQEAHFALRGLLEEAFEFRAERVPILYGGSVSPENAALLLRQPDVDGVLVGGASLEARAFLEIASSTSEP